MASRPLIDQIEAGPVTVAVAVDVVAPASQVLPLATLPPFRTDNSAKP